MDKNLRIEIYKTDNLIFDPENPRLPKSVDGSDMSSVINWMLENENVLELMASIAEKGFFPAEPLLVSPSTTNKGRYIVIEGNRRLTAVKILLNPTIATSRKNAIQEIIQESSDLNKLDELPVICFKYPDEVQSYLGYRHITGVQPWDSLAKARYLKRIKHTIKEDDLSILYKRLAKIIGSRADHVKLLLTGLDVYESIEENSFFGIKDLDEKSIKFGVLYTALNNNNISTFLNVDFEIDEPAKNINIGRLDELSHWMFEKNGEGFTRLGESRNLRLLNKVVNNPRALQAFRKEKSLKDSVLLTDEPQEIFQVSTSDAFNKLQTARDYVHLIEEPSSKDEETLLEITKLSRTLSNTLKAKHLEDSTD